MFLVSNLSFGLLWCVVCCICWGSWGNTQKLVAQQNWRSELFYFDFTIGFFLTSLIGALTLGSFGSDGESFFSNLQHASAASVGWALLGGVVWNFANIFLSAAIALAGMSVGFPIGGGIGWIGGIIFNYILVVAAGGIYPGNQLLLWVGVAIVIVAIVLNGKAYGKLSSQQKKTPLKGIVSAAISGIGFIFFYGLVLKAIDPQYSNGTGTGNLTPYTAVFFFGLAVLLTTPIFNTLIMKHPLTGAPVPVSDYRKGDARTHLIGMLGGFIWMFGMIVSFMSANAHVNAAISYALSNASPVVAMIWGFWIWREFKDAPRGTNRLVYATFTLFIVGLVLITLSNG
jgi:glucose uptake protein